MTHIHFSLAGATVREGAGKETAACIFGVNIDDEDGGVNGNEKSNTASNPGNISEID